MTDPVKIIVGEGDITEVNVPDYNLIQTGSGGSDGATFFPEVSEEGVISWTNDGGYDNPEPVNIKGPAGNDGSDGEDGQNGVTFTPSVSDAGIISWTNDGDLPNPSPVNIKGSDGEDGEDGVSPVVTFGEITGGHTMTVTDKTHPTGQTINIMDGTQGQTGPAGPGVPAGGTTGQVLAKSSNADYATRWVDQSGGGGGTSDYDDLTDKPSINNVTLSGNKTAADLGLGTYSKPSGGIPQTDLAQTVQNKLDSTVVVSDTQPTETENKLWVDTDAGTGTSYQIPTVAEMEAADAQVAALIDVKHVPVWPTPTKYNSVQDVVDVMSTLPTNSFLLNAFGNTLRTDLFDTASSYDGFLVCYKASGNNIYYLAYSRDVAAIGNINIPNVSVTYKHSLL